MHKNSEINFKKGDNLYLGYRDQMKSDQRIFFIDILQDIQREANLGELNRPQRVSTTRWWSHQKALETVFFAQSGKLYDCFRDALGHCFAPEHSKETVTNAEAYCKRYLASKWSLRLIFFTRFSQSLILHFCEAQEGAGCSVQR